MKFYISKRTEVKVAGTSIDCRVITHPMLFLHLVKELYYCLCRFEPGLEVALLMLYSVTVGLFFSSGLPPPQKKKKKTSVGS